MGLNIARLRQSYELLEPHGDTLVETFYQHLFADYPAVKPLFASVDMQDQKKKLLTSLQLVVDNLRRPEALATALQQMGQRHVAYGAQEAQYTAFVATLLKSMAEVVGEAWNDELTDAWSEAFGEISKAMLVGAALSVG